MREFSAHEKPTSSLITLMILNLFSVQNGEKQEAICADLKSLIFADAAYSGELEKLLVIFPFYFDSNLAV